MMLARRIVGMRIPAVTHHSTRCWSVASPLFIQSSITRSYCTPKEADGPALRKKLQADLAASMKARDKDKLAAIRLITSKIQNKDIEAGQNVDHVGIMEVMQTMMMAATETEKEYLDHKRDDLAKKERALIDTLQGYLPAQLTREEIRKEASEVIAKLNATSLKDIGKVIEALKGKAHTKIIGEVVKELLTKK